MSEQIVAPPGLSNVVVSDTGTGDVLGREGFYHFRGYPATELARHRTFEEVCHLMVEGELPTATEAQAFSGELAKNAQLPDALADVLPRIAESGDDRQSMTRLRTAVSHLGASEQFPPTWGTDRATVRRNVLRLVATVPTVQAALFRLRGGRTPVAPRPDLGLAANWLWMLTGEEPQPRHVEAIGTYLTCTIDHGFSPSTFTARVVTSAGSDVASAVCAALGTFAGPLHGGAPDRALDALDEIGSPDRTRAWVREKVASGDRIMGFGHAVYRTLDPRSALLRDIATSFGGPRVDFATRVETEVTSALAELKPGRELHTNVEFYAGVLMELCGVPREMFTPTFANARVVGWAAHILEQTASAKIYRPLARYVGPGAPRPLS